MMWIKKEIKYYHHAHDDVWISEMALSHRSSDYLTNVYFQGWRGFPYASSLYIIDYVSTGLILFILIDFVSLMW